MGALFTKPSAAGPIDIELARLSKLWFEVSSAPHSQRKGTQCTWQFDFQGSELLLERSCDGTSLGSTALIPNYAYVNAYPTPNEKQAAAFQCVEANEQDRPLWILQVDERYTAMLACEPDTKDYYVLAAISVVALNDMLNFLQDCYSANKLDNDTAQQLFAEAQHRGTAR